MPVLAGPSRADDLGGLRSCGSSKALSSLLRFCRLEPMRSEVTTMKPLDPGWYPDPDSAHGVRWWDGAKWRSEPGHDAGPRPARWEVSLIGAQDSNRRVDVVVMALGSARARVVGEISKATGDSEKRINKLLDELPVAVGRACERPKAEELVAALRTWGSEAVLVQANVGPRPVSPSGSPIDKNVAFGLLLSVAFALAAGGLILMGLNNTSDSSSVPSRTQSGDPIAALTSCQQAVERRLLSPSSARFQPAGQATIREIQTDEWSVESWVDADNAFGATLRTPWICQVTHRNGGYSPRVQLLD